MRAVDLFAGAGGMSEGARMAGVETVWAGNHWKAACEAYEVNHGIKPVCQDLMQADWREVPVHDILLAAPACQGHTPARGKEKPHHDALRNTAWAVVSCAEYHRPEFCVVENVPAFLDWLLYPAWELAMRKLGYQLTQVLIDAADHGVPQNRVRLFNVASRTRRRLKLEMPKREHRPIAEVIEWDKHKWVPVAEKVEKTRARWQRGRKQFGERFVMPYYSSGSGLTGRSIHRPIGTITTTDRWAIVQGDMMRMLHVNEAKAAMGFKKEYWLPDSHREAMKMLGNGVSPVAMNDLICAIREAA